MPWVDYGVVLWSGSPVFLHDRARDEDGVPLRPAFAFGPGGRFLFEYDPQIWEPIAGWRLRSHIRASRLGKANFFGLGNATSRDGAPASFFRVDQTQYEFGLPLTHSTADGRVRLSVGPVLRYTRSEDSAEHFGAPVDEHARLLSVSRPFGSGLFGELGAATEVVVGTSSTDGMGGLGMTARASAFPALLSVTSPFARFDGELRGGLTVPLPASPTLAIRVGGARVVGNHPFFEAASLGGSGTLRGFAHERFLGDASVYGGADLRLRIGTLRALGTSASYGAVALADAGRVFLHGQSPGGWHVDAGGGVWLQPAGSPSVLQLAIVRSAEGTRLSAGFKLPYE